MGVVSRFGRFGRRYGAHLVGAVIVVYAALAVPTGYYIVSPGEVRPLTPSVVVENAVPGRQTGFHLVTVETRKTNAVLHLWGLIDPYSRLRRSEEFLPPGRTEKEYFEEMGRMMKESQETAKVVALRKMGYDARLSGGGVRVVSVLPSGGASGVLMPGDIIVGLDGRETLLADDLIHEMSKRAPGQSVTLEVLRQGGKIKVTAPTGPHPEDPERAALG
ncbi:MAG: PDZ domain-containing protein, partial [Firmicutes bacterium]|nr:PDZ domain-containing protein [Bacillota bacterium]